MSKRPSKKKPIESQGPTRNFADELQLHLHKIEVGTRTIMECGGKNWPSDWGDEQEVKHLAADLVEKLRRFRSLKLDSDERTVLALEMGEAVGMLTFINRDAIRQKVKRIEASQGANERKRTKADVRFREIVSLYWRERVGKVSHWAAVERIKKYSTSTVRRALKEYGIEHDTNREDWHRENTLFTP